MAQTDVLQPKPWVGDDQNQDIVIDPQSLQKEIQQQIADDIKQQQLEQQQLQQKKDLLSDDNTTNNIDPNISININMKMTNHKNKLENNAIYCYNDIVILNDDREGQIKFIGTLGFNSETWYGLILTTPTGSHNGTVKNRKYWICDDNHGTFVKKNQINKIKTERAGNRYTIHGKVKTTKGKAIIRFIGEIHDINDKNGKNDDDNDNDNHKLMYGVELIDGFGVNSGSLNNEYYFQCAHYRGVFYAENDLTYIAPNAPPTPKLSPIEKKKKKDKKKTKQNLKVAASLLDQSKLQKDDNGFVFDDQDDDGDDDDDSSYSDSSSDDEFLSSDDVHRISLMSSGKNSRMSFARILSDFKDIQKKNVRSIAAVYENKNKQQRVSTSGIQKKVNREAELAKQLIASSRSRRADTMPNNAASVYQPPKFADDIIDRSKQFKRKKKMITAAQSQPVSPAIVPRLTNKAASLDVNDQISKNVPLFNNKMKSLKGGFAKAQPKGRRGKRRPGKGRRKVTFTNDDDGIASTPSFGAASSSLTSPTASEPDDGVSGAISPMTLSPASYASKPTTIIEEPMELVDEEPEPDNNSKSADKLDKSRSKSVPIQPDTALASGSRSSITKFKDIQTPAPIKHTSTNSDSGNGGYASPGIISPGGGVPSLKLQTSASFDHMASTDFAATVDDPTASPIPPSSDNADPTSSAAVMSSSSSGSPKSPTTTPGLSDKSSNNSNTSGGNNSKKDLKLKLQLAHNISNSLSGSKSKSKSGALSPTATQVYSWVFKPADEKDKKSGADFQLKAQPDSPFDVSSTFKDFSKVAEVLMLDCNNPKNLFKVLKGVCAKLKLSNPKYRRIDTLNRAVQSKLLKFSGADEFLILLGFEQTDASPNFWICPSDQPPLSVLENAIAVCNDALFKCNQKRATIDMIKKFTKHDLKSKKNKKKGKKNKRKGKKGKKHASSSLLLSKKNKSLTKLRENKASMSSAMELVVNVSSGVGIKNNKDNYGSGTATPPIGTGTSSNIILKQPNSLSLSHPSTSISMDIGLGDMLDVPGTSVSISSDKSAPTLPMFKTNSIRIDDTTDTLSVDDLKFEEELEGGDEDRFQLSDIIWSITHKDNTDKDARFIILLCYPTFSEPMKLLKCLVERFFSSDDMTSNKDPNSSRRSSLSFSDSQTMTSTTTTHTQPLHSPKSTLSTTISTATTPNSSTLRKFDFYHRIESCWEVQVKVVSFIQQWMRSYWVEDWDANDKMLDFIELFCDKVENGYKNDPTQDDNDIKKGMKLIKMIHQTMDSQEANLRTIKKKALLRQSSTTLKFDRMVGMNTTVSKMRHDFLKIDNLRIAQQITLLDFKCFKSIKKRECLGQAWKKKNKYEISRNVCALIDQFNRMSKWVQATILLATNVKKRGRLIKKFIKIANLLFMLRNFQSLCAFHGALTSVPIHKLKHAWSYVPAKHVARFEEMRVIFNTRNNMANLRKLHREAHAPLVPYTGIFLSDLVSIEEGNRKRKDDGTVNFSKLMRLSNAIDSILIYQRTPYEFIEDHGIQNLLLTDFKMNEKLDPDYIYQFSSDVAKKDQPSKKKSMLSLFGKNDKKKTKKKSRLSKKMKSLSVK